MKGAGRQAIERLQSASLLETTHLLQQWELYDEKSSQEIIDEVYVQFASGEHIKDEIVKPVFLSVIDGFLEASPGGRAARKRGLTASRVLQECESFAYDKTVLNAGETGAYIEYKNARDIEDVNANMSQTYNRARYEDKAAMDNYKKDKLKGEKTLVDEYKGKKNLYLERKNPNRHYNDEMHRKQAQSDHIIPLKKIHDEFKGNYALDDSDIKRIANIDDNLAVTSAEINQAKKEKTNEEFIQWMDENGMPVDKATKENMLLLSKNAQEKIAGKANEAVLDNILGNGKADEAAMEAAVEQFKKENGGESPTKQEEQEIEARLIQEKAAGIRRITAKNAARQACDYAVGNLLLFIVKPLYYEISDIFKNGLEDGVNAGSAAEALEIRLKRVKRHVLIHAKGFLGSNFWEFVKGFVSSFIEGFIGLFTGVFKHVLKLVKEGIKIFVQSAKILFGKQAKVMSPAEKGDAIIKLIGGSVIAISGIGIESLFSKIGIVEPWSVVLSTMFSGIASALFMYLLDQIDLFSLKAEKRKNRILDIFAERKKDINEAAETYNLAAIETLRRQREKFEDISEEINAGLKAGGSIRVINGALYKMAELMKVDLPYSNTEEFVDYMDSKDAILL